jgi:hypothetical protein
MPQTPNTRGLTLSGVVISLAMLCFVRGDCKGGMQWLLEQGLLSCNALSILAAVYSACSLQFITNKIIGTQGQNSRVLMSSSGMVFTASCLHRKIRVQTVKHNVQREQVGSIDPL